MVNLAAHGASGEESDVSIRLDACNVPGASAGVLLEEQLVPMASPALLSRVAPAGPADLLRAPRLQHGDRPHLWSRWFEAAGATDLAPSSGPRHDSSDVLVAAAIEGHGLALLSEVLLARELTAGRLQIAFPIPIVSGLSFRVDLSRKSLSSLSAQLFQHWLLQEAGACPTSTIVKGAMAVAHLPRNKISDRSSKPKPT
jgi:LysR family transcriptional regulator, glycine cleavage system transcriptional activator